MFVFNSRNTKDRQQLPELGRGKDGTTPRTFRESQVLPMPGFQNVTTDSVVLSYPV